MQCENTDNALDLKAMLLREMERRDPEIYAKILCFQSHFLSNEVPSERYSITFLLDLFYVFEHGSINIHKIMHEVKYLEGRNIQSRTKSATQFKRPPLKGLWHKHYYDGSVSAMAMNIRNALGNYGIPYFEQKIQEAKESGVEQFVTIEDIPHIVNDAISGNLKRRTEEQKTTGEWLVYAIHNNINYYICLAKHGEDEAVRNKINSSCIYEFPFLHAILP